MGFRRDLEDEPEGRISGLTRLASEMKIGQVAPNLREGVFPTAMPSSSHSLPPEARPNLIWRSYALRSLASPRVPQR
jgi:hypothetical protein